MSLILRNLLLAGAAVIALSAVACSKPAANTGDSSSAPAMSDAADASAAMDAAAAASADAK